MVMPLKGFSFVAVEMLSSFDILFKQLNVLDALPIWILISFIISPSYFMQEPNYTKSSASLSLESPILTHGVSGALSFISLVFSVMIVSPTSPLCHGPASIYRLHSPDLAASTFNHVKFSQDEVKKTMLKSKEDSTLPCLTPVATVNQSV